MKKNRKSCNPGGNATAAANAAQERVLGIGHHREFGPWEKVGVIGVDAGVCWLGDPCYCVTPDAENHPAPTWPEFVDALYSKDKDGPTCVQFNFAGGHPGLGVCVSAGFGDGLYDVYVKRARTEAGPRIAELKVVFIES